MVQKQKWSHLDGARRPLVVLWGYPHLSADMTTPTRLSLLCTYTTDRSAVHNGLRLMVFTHTELNDTTGGDSERFCKK